MKIDFEAIFSPPPPERWRLIAGEDRVDCLAPYYKLRCGCPACEHRRRTHLRQQIELERQRLAASATQKRRWWRRRKEHNA